MTVWTKIVLINRVKLVLAYALTSNKRIQYAINAVQLTLDFLEASAGIFFKECIARALFRPRNMFYFDWQTSAIRSKGMNEDQVIFFLADTFTGFKWVKLASRTETFAFGIEEART